MNFLKKAMFTLYGITLIILFFRYGLIFKQVGESTFFSIPSGINTIGYVLIAVLLLSIIGNTILTNIARKKAKEEETNEDKAEATA